MQPTSLDKSSRENPIRNALDELRAARAQRASELEQLDRAIEDLTRLIGGSSRMITPARKKAPVVKRRTPANSKAAADEVAALLATFRKRPVEIRSALREHGIAMSQREMQRLLASDPRFDRTGPGWWGLVQRDPVATARLGAAE